MQLRNGVPAATPRGSGSVQGCDQRDAAAKGGQTKGHRGGVPRVTKYSMTANTIIPLLMTICHSTLSRCRIGLLAMLLRI
jgi:hypothetical protein